MPYWKMEQVSFVRDHGCSIESPLNHQSKSNAGAGIGSEWLAGEGTGLSLSQPALVREATRCGARLP